MKDILFYTLIFIFVVIPSLFVLYGAYKCGTTPEKVKRRKSTYKKKSNKRRK